MNWMNRSKLAVVVTVICLGTASFAPALGGDDAKKAGHATGEMPEMPPEWQEWMKYAAPGEHHAHMESLIGSWNIRSTMWMTPGAEPMISEGTSTNKWVLGKRFMLQHYKSMMMGEEFVGMGMFGYDNYKQQHISAWADTMGTMLGMSHGGCSDGGNVITLTMEYEDPMTKSMKSMRMVTTIQSDDKHVLEMFGDADDGTEYRSMEIVYTRK